MNSRSGIAAEGRSMAVGAISAPAPRTIFRIVSLIAAAAAATAGLYGFSRQNYLLVHSLAELLSIAVAWGVFMLVWNSRRFVQNQALLFLGIALAFIGFLDLLHTLAYKGMGVFEEGDANRPTQLWIAARYVQALALLAFPLLFGSRPRPAGVSAILALVTGALLLAIFVWDVFPACYVDGQGLTAFKITSEYIICAILAASLILLHRRRQALDADVYRLMAIAIGFSIAAELSFTLYTDVYGLLNFAGHILKVAAFAMVYLGLIRIGLTKPNALLYRELAQKREELSAERSVLQTILTAAPDFLVLKDRDSVYRKVNPAFCRFLGRSEEEIVGKRDADLFPPGDAEQYTKGDQAVMASGRMDLGDWSVMGKEGRHWMQVITTPVFAESHHGSVCGVLCSARDITRRKRMEELVQARLRLSEFAHDHSLPDLLQKTIDEAERLTGSAIGFLHFVEDDQETLSLQMWSSHTLHHMCTAEGAGRHYPVSQAGVWVDCLRERRPVIHNDYSALTHRKGTPHGHAPVVRELVVPIFQGGKAVAILGVGNKETDYAPADIDMVAELGSMAWDLVVRKEAETDLRKAREHYRLVADFTHDWEYWQDPEGKFIYVSPSCERVSGYPPSHFMDHAGAILDITHPEDRRNLKSHFDQVVESCSGPCELEFRIIRKDGDVRWINHTCWAVYTDDHVYRGRRGSHRDITDPKRKEREILESEERSRRLIEASADAILVRSGGIIIYANPAALTLFGAEGAPDLIGKPYLDLVHPDDRALSAERAKRCVDENWVASPREHRILTLSGQVVEVESTAVPFQHRGEIQLFGVYRDITERKKAAQDRAKFELQLRQAQKMEAIGTLAGGIAHDFNNILGVIIGNCEMMTFKDETAPSPRENIAPILTAANRAKKLVSQILTFSRQGEQQKLLISLKPVIKETIEFLRSSLPATIQVSQYLSPLSGAILADPTQMQQILMNLCTNAAHAMEGSGGVLNIELDNASVTGTECQLGPGVEPGDYLKLTVSDTGHGMEAWVRERIFDPYFTTKGPGKGTGLGLAVVHGIVQSHGGTIKVYSEPGKGTIFHVYIPRADGAERAEAPAVQPLPRGSERVLIVDDEPALADIAGRMLSFLGYSVESRTSSIEALELFRTHPERFDAVVTDMTMPQLTGLNLAREIMAIRPELPIILCTGFSEQAEEARAHAAGIRSFLFKPLVIAELANSLRSVLDETRPKCL